MAVSKEYGFTKVHKADLPAAHLDQTPFHEMVGAFAKLIDDIKPQIVDLPNRSDIHTDHQIIFKAAISCTKNFRYPFIEKILMYETISETDFVAPLHPHRPALLPARGTPVSGVFRECG